MIPLGRTILGLALTFPTRKLLTQSPQPSSQIRTTGMRDSIHKLTIAQKDAVIPRVQRGIERRHQNGGGALVM